jgi:hypothetical protein
LQHSLFDIAFTTALKRRIIFALEPGSEDQAIFQAMILKKDPH